MCRFPRRSRRGPIEAELSAALEAALDEFSTSIKTCPIEATLAGRRSAHSRTVLQVDQDVVNRQKRWTGELATPAGRSPRLYSGRSGGARRSLEPRIRLRPPGTSGNHRLRRSVDGPRADLRWGDARNRLACGFGVRRRSRRQPDHPGARAGPARLLGSAASAGTNGPAGGKQPGGNSAVRSPARSRGAASR